MTVYEELREAHRDPIVRFTYNELPLHVRGMSVRRVFIPIENGARRPMENSIRTAIWRELA